MLYLKNMDRLMRVLFLLCVILFFTMLSNVYYVSGFYQAAASHTGLNLWLSSIPWLLLMIIGMFAAIINWYGYYLFILLISYKLVYEAYLELSDLFKSFPLIFGFHGVIAYLDGFFVITMVALAVFALVQRSVNVSITVKKSKRLCLVLGCAKREIVLACITLVVTFAYLLL